MISYIRKFLTGDGLKVRAVRGSLITFTGFGLQNVLRLGSNLILTRLLFPEAFGLMALVMVFVSALQLFSDFGLRASVVRSERGDDPDYLNTGWTIQIGRGVILWLGTCALAWPAAALYGESMLAQLLPVVGISAIIAGFNSTKVMTANRHMVLGRLTLMAILAQSTTILTMIVLASTILPSVWALAVGTIAGAVMKMTLSHVLLPGPLNKIRLERAAAIDMFHFGKFIFASTAASFLINHADRAILGAYISLEELSFYTIAFFLASVPTLVNYQFVEKILFPLYREKPPLENSENRRKIGLLRFGLVGFLTVFSLMISTSGIVLIDVLYDPRYALAGPILVLLALSRIPELLVGSYAHLLLGAGLSKDFAILNVSSALIRTTVILIGVSQFGLLGGIFAPVISLVLSYPLYAYYARRLGGWFGGQDVLIIGISLGAGALIMWMNPGILAAF